MRYFLKCVTNKFSMDFWFDLETVLYAYFHAIVLSGAHEQMKVAKERQTSVVRPHALQSYLEIKCFGRYTC